MPEYLDDSGNPTGKVKVYLDETTGEPIRPELTPVTAMTDERGKTLSFPRMEPARPEHFDPTTTEGKINTAMSAASGIIAAGGPVQAGVKLLKYLVPSWAGSKIGREVGGTAAGPTGAEVGAVVGGLAGGIGGPKVLGTAARLVPGSMAGRLAASLAEAEASAAPTAAASVPRAFPQAARSMTVSLPSRASSTLPGAVSVPSLTASAVKAVPAATESASAAVTPGAVRAAQAARYINFAKQAAQTTPKNGKIWMELDELGNPVRILTPDQAGAAARAGKATTWIKNLWR